MVSCVHRKFQTRAGLSGDINKSFEYVTIADSKFSNRVLHGMNDAREHIHKLGNNMT